MIVFQVVKWSLTELLTIINNFNHKEEYSEIPTTTKHCPSIVHKKGQNEWRGSNSFVRKLWFHEINAICAWHEKSFLQKILLISFLQNHLVHTHIITILSWNMAWDDILLNPSQSSCSQLFHWFMFQLIFHVRKRTFVMSHLENIKYCGTHFFSSEQTTDFYSNPYEACIVKAIIQKPSSFLVLYFLSYYCWRGESVIFGIIIGMYVYCVELILQ